MSTLTIATDTNWSGLEDTSTSAIAVSFASKSLTVSAGKAWVTGMPLAMTAVGTKLHTCMVSSTGVTSYSGTTLQFTTNGYTSSATSVGVVATMWGQFANQALSQSSVVIGSSGTKVFWTRPNLTLVPGDVIRAVFRTTMTTLIEGTVASYHAATGNLVMTATASSGSGTVTDWIIVSAGTISNWIIHPVHNDTIAISNGVTLTIDQTNYGLPANVSAIGTGQVYVPNVSTSGPICFRLSCRVHTTNYGRFTIQQNASFKTRGNWIEIATGTGSALSYTFPAAWDAMSAPTLVEVETGSGTGVYERWPTVGSMFYGLNRYGHMYGGEIGKTPTNLLIKWAGGGTGISTLGTIVGGTGYGGVLSTLGTLTGGTGGTAGTYTNVPLTVSSGTVGNGATANITVYGGSVVAVQIVNPGSGYSTTSVLSAATGNIGNTTGFSTTVSAVLAAWVFANVPLTGGTGSGAIANITIAAGIVTAVEIVNAGTGYTVADSLSAATTYLGAGASFTVPVSTIGVPTGTFKCSGGSGANGLITITAINTAGIGRLGTITGGSGYVNGTYNDVPLTATGASAGAGARANIVVSGGAVTSVTLLTTGYGYTTALGVTALNTFLGGSGSGFTVIPSQVGQSLQGAYFSGYDGTPSPYAVGDLLTVECGGSMKPVLYVAEVGDFSNTTPATNIVSSICETIPTQFSGYQQYFIYNCTGGSGTGAKYTVINGGSGSTRTVGSQYGYFVAGTGYAVNDIITVGEFGFQVRVTEINNSLTANFTNKVCSWDPAGRTLRFGADPDSAAVPNGAKVRVPNIIIDSLPYELPLIQAVTESSPTWYFESTAAIATGITASATQCDYECVGSGAFANNTIAMNSRGARGTRKATHAAGAIVTDLPAGRATGFQRAQFNTSTGGEIDLDKTMFGYWFMFSSASTRNISATNVGWSGSLIAGTTTGPIVIDKFCNSCHPFQINEQQWSITSVQNNFALSNGVCAQIKAADTNTSEPFISVSNCPSISKFSNLDVFTAREWQGSNRSIQLINSFFTNDTTAVPQYIRLVGGMMYISTMANFRMHHISFGANCCRTLSAITPAGSFSYTNTAYSNGAFLFTNSSNIIAHNLDTVAQPIKGFLAYSDTGCANIIVHTGNGSLGGIPGYFGNGAFAGINLLQGILNNTGLNVKIANFHASNIRNAFTYIQNNTQTQNIIQNVRTPSVLTNQNGTQTDYTSTTLNFRSSTANGPGHGSLDSYDYVAGYTPYWATGGSMAPNLPDATWFMNLVDQGISPTTGRISIGCGGPNSQKTQYVITGSNNSYPDNGGRFYLGQSNDMVEFTNWYPLRGITGFQSVNPASNFDSVVINATDGWFRYTITNAGSGYSNSTTHYGISGGSGYGGTFINNGGATTIVGGRMASGIGYQVGDVLTIVGGGNNATITLTAVKTVQVRMVPWGQDITTATYVNLTYANLQSAFAAMTGYDSNVGLQIQMKVANDSNTHDLNGYMNWYELFTTVDPSFAPPVGYTDIDLSGLQNGSRIAAYSGSTLLDSDTSTTSGVLTVPYSFDGSVASADIKIKKYGYYNANYSQDYGKDNASKTVSQFVDSNITQTNKATVVAYTDLGDTIKLYDYCQYYFTTPAADLLAQFCTKNGTELNFGSYNLVFDAAAGSVFSLVGSTITIKANFITNGSIITSGTVTYLNGATAQTIITSSAGTTGIFTLSGLNSHNVYLENSSFVQQDYQTNVSSYSFYIPAGLTGSWRWRAVKYGNIPETGTFVVTGGGRFAATLGNITDSKISQPTLVTVLAYTSLDTWDKVYDYCQAYLTTSSGKTLGQFAAANGAAVDIGSYALTVDAVAGSVFALSSGITIKASALVAGSIFAGGITSGTVSAVNGAIINTWYTSSAGRSVLILAPNIMINSRTWLYNMTSSVTIDNSVVGASGVYVRLLWTVDSTVKLTATCLDCLSLVTSGVLTNTGLTFLSSQTTDSVYSTNGVNGTLCDSSNGGEFTADLPNVQIDINDPDNITYLARIYAWAKYYETTSSGIISFLDAVSVSDTANYIINGAIVDLAFDNKKTNLLTVSGGYVSKTGGTSLVAATTTGSIYFDSGKAYVAPNSGGATLAQIEGSTILAKEATVNTRLAASAYTAPDNTGVAAIKAKTDNLPASPAAVGSAMTLTSAYDAAKTAASQTSVDNLAIAGAISDYAPTSITVNAGSIASGSVGSLAARDNNFLRIVENTSTGLELIVTRATTVITETPSVLRITGYYVGGNGHYINIQPWDYVTSSWVTTAIMYPTTSSFDYIVPLNSNNHNVSTGEMKVRFIHNVTNYNNSHDLYLDYVAFENVQTNSSLGSDIAKILNNQQVQMNAEILDSGTAQGPGTGTNQIQLAVTASPVTGTYDPGLVRIIGGAGAGQTGIILQYDGTTRTATVHRDWKIAIDSTSQYAITPYAAINVVNEGLIQAATSGTATLNVNASPINDTYIGQCVFVVSGAGADQTNIVIAYNGTTKVATMAAPWKTIPDSTSGYVMLPISPVLLAATNHVGATIPTVTNVTNGAGGATLAQIEGSTVLAKDATVLTRLAASSYTAPDNMSIAAIVAKLPSASANIAGEGAIAKNLDQVSGGGGGGGATLAEIEASTVLAKEASVQLSIALSA